ncbi:2-polyprenyl-6-methoxyphenol hydroxylase [Rhodopseudomonas palustris]|uniref:2-polyprenyl-6-methoxyphenol hydroxylase n=1 Tax=Rhodopseudomonas palustris TaxID=1076 RepID=A0A323UN22_RHOPL|nr:FAD-dependent monooxygenase [Rhodopseudomonas palustris]PZA13779.1 2-polyprenyl-6-methoxyphenol hydroxylase [Rhodopseudomonas palustris]
MKTPLAVIVGAGVAGLAAAWWLQRIGWRTLIVERSGSLRDSGYMIGLSGPGYDAVTRMGLLPLLQSASYEINENVYRDRHGKEILRLRYRDVLRGLPYLAVRRSDLVDVMREAINSDTEIRLGTTVTTITETADLVTVGLSDGTTIKADLLIGADGVRSACRQTLFGNADCLVPLGYRFAVYDIDVSVPIDADFLSYTEPGHLAEYYALKDGHLAAMHVWRDVDSSWLPPEQRWALLDRVVARSHLDVRRFMEMARSGPPPTLDSLILVDLPRWSKGRVTLLGDSAHCLTLVSGQGAGMAIASAELLAQALARTSVPEALRQHDASLRPAIHRLQLRSRRMATMFIPNSAAGFYVRNLILRHMPRPWLGRYLASAARSEVSLISS